MSSAYASEPRPTRRFSGHGAAGPIAPARRASRNEASVLMESPFGRGVPVGPPDLIRTGEGGDRLSLGGGPDRAFLGAGHDGITVGADHTADLINCGPDHDRVLIMHPRVACSAAVPPTSTTGTALTGQIDDWTHPTQRSSGRPIMLGASRATLTRIGPVSALTATPSTSSSRTHALTWFAPNHVLHSRSTVDLQPPASTSGRGREPVHRRHGTPSAQHVVVLCVPRADKPRFETRDHADGSAWLRRFVRMRGGTSNWT